MGKRNAVNAVNERMLSYEKESMLIQVRKHSGMSISASNSCYKKQNSYITINVYMYQKPLQQCYSPL
jgi:hypothetical protein